MRGVEEMMSPSFQTWLSLMTLPSASVCFVPSAFLRAMDTVRLRGATPPMSPVSGESYPLAQLIMFCASASEDACRNDLIMHLSFAPMAAQSIAARSYKPATENPPPPHPLAVLPYR